MHQSQWDEPMERIDELAERLLKLSPIFTVELVEIRGLLTAIRDEAIQQERDLESIFSVLESIQSRNYANGQEAPHDAEF